MAARFYRRLVDQNRRSHLAFLENDQAGTQYSEAPSTLPRALIFSGKIVTTEMNTGAHIDRGRAVMLPGKTAARWLGGFDLLHLQNLSAHSVRSSDLIEALVSCGGSRSSAAALLQWCLKKNVLRPAPSREADHPVSGVDA